MASRHCDEHGASHSQTSRSSLLTTFADQAVIAIENVRLFDEIQDKSRQLAEASQHKSQFLANMSHELRTPLNAILGYTELILDSVYGEMPEKARERARSRAAQWSASPRPDQRRARSVQDRGWPAHPLAFGLLAQECHPDRLQRGRAIGDAEELALKIDVAPELPQGHGDERGSRRFCSTSSATRSNSPIAGEVSIKGSSANGTFTVAVRDTGPGISTADQAKLFQEFQQADNSITRKKGGTGLGLAISKRIIEMHGGRISVESRPGNGSTFAFTLPVIVEGQVRPA